MEHSVKRTEATSAGTQTDTDGHTATGSPKKILSLYAVSFLIVTTLVVGFIWHDLRREYRETLAYWNVQLSSSADERVKVSALWLKERRTDTFAISENAGTIRLLSVGGSKSPGAEILECLRVLNPAVRIAIVFPVGGGHKFLEYVAQKRGVPLAVVPNHSAAIEWVNRDQ